MADIEHNGTGQLPRFRLGQHEDWLPGEAVQRLIDILHERNRPYLSSLLGEVFTGERPKAGRS